MDVYQTVTDRIVAMIERGADKWQMPWHVAPAGEPGAPVAMPRNVTGRAYRGVNVPLLWASAEAFGYPSPIWATYKQWEERGAQVRRGEKSTLVVFWKRIEVASEPDGDDSDGDSETRLIARGYAVFNAAQVDGFDPPPTAGGAAKRPEPQRIEAAEAFFRNTGAAVRHGGNRAFYTTAGDFIQMPELRQFVAADRYYSTLAHEHVHWTGAAHRCAREFGKRFGDEAYAFEELVAELGAAFLCADLSLSNEPRPDHAAYIANWLTVLRNDKRAIFTAASKAQAAADFLAGLQTTTDARLAA
jgi:antirestriction protein ArdC